MKPPGAISSLSPFAKKADVPKPSSAINSPSPIQIPLELCFYKPIDGDPDRMFKASVYERHTLGHERAALVSYSHPILLTQKQAPFHFHPGSLQASPPASCQSTWTLTDLWRHTFPMRISLTHLFAIDTRNDKLLPISGFFFRLSNEFSPGFQKMERACKRMSRFGNPFWQPPRQCALGSCRGRGRTFPLMPLGLGGRRVFEGLSQPPD